MSRIILILSSSLLFEKRGESSDIWANHLVISEVLFGLLGAAGKEFVEIYNPTEDFIDLYNLPENGGKLNLIFVSTGDSHSNKTIQWGTNTIIPPYGYFLFCFLRL
jgi:hypothetical protein